MITFKTEREPIFHQVGQLNLMEDDNTIWDVVRTLSQLALNDCVKEGR